MTRPAVWGAVCFGMAAAIGLSAEVQAAGLSVREQSAEGQGAAFAGVAAGTNGLSSLFWNPATASLHDGLNSESNAALLLPWSRADDGTATGDSGDIGVMAIVPASYGAWQFNDMVYLGLALNSPFGLSTRNAGDWKGAPHGTESDLLTINANPSVALKLSEQFSIGLGLQVEYVSANLESNLPGGAFLSDVEGDDVGLGWTAGLLFAPTPATEIGLGFRSSVKHRIEGHGTIASAGTFDISAPFSTPEIVTLGIRHDVNDKLTLLGGVEWTNWSRLENLAITFEGLGTSTVSENWHDSWYVSLGGEYAFSDTLTLRAGLAYEATSVPDATRTPRVPDNNRYWLSAGASYRLADWATAQVAYSHVFVEDGAVALDGSESSPSNGPLSAVYKQHLDIVSAGLAIGW